METKKNNHEALCSKISEVKGTAKVISDTTEEICIIDESINHSEVLNDESFGDDDDLENFICDEIICDPYSKEEPVKYKSNNVSFDVECTNGEELDSSCSSEVDVELISDYKFEEVARNEDKVASTLKKNCTKVSSTPKISPEPDLKLNSSKNRKLVSDSNGISCLDEVRNLSNSQKTCSVNYEDCEIIYDKILDDLAPEYVSSTSELPAKDLQIISECVVKSSNGFEAVSVSPTVTEASIRSPLGDSEHSRNIGSMFPNTADDGKFSNSADAEIEKVTSENSLSALEVECCDVEKTVQSSNTFDEVQLPKDVIGNKIEEREKEEVLEMGKEGFQSSVTHDGVGSTNEDVFLNNWNSGLANRIVGGIEENNSKASESPESDHIQSLESRNSFVSLESECSSSISHRQPSVAVIDLNIKNGCTNFSNSEASENYSELGKSLSSSKTYINQEVIREPSVTSPEPKKISSYPECSNNFSNCKSISNCNAEKVEDSSGREKHSTDLSLLENYSGSVQICGEDFGHTLNDLADSSTVKKIPSSTSKLPGEKLVSSNSSSSAVHLKHDNSSLDETFDKPEKDLSTLKDEEVSMENINEKGNNVNKKYSGLESSHDSFNSTVENNSDEFLQSFRSEKSKEILSEKELIELPTNKLATYHVNSEGLSDAVTGLEEIPISNLEKCVKHIDTNPSCSETNRKENEKESTLEAAQEEKEALLKTGESDNHDSVQLSATEEYKITNCRYLEDKPEVPNPLDDPCVSKPPSCPREENDGKFVTDEESDSSVSCMSRKKICKTSQEKVEPPSELGEKHGLSLLSKSDKSENISIDSDSNNSQRKKQNFINNTVNTVTENNGLSNNEEVHLSEVKQDSSSGSASSPNVLQQVEKRIRRSSSKLYLRMKQEVQELCCGHWFPNTKSFIRHLIENSKTETDSLHAAKLVDFGMQKCKNCSIWLNSARMKRHMKVEHETLKTREESKCGSTNSVDPSSKILPDSERVSPLPNESSQSRKVTKVSSEAKTRKPILLNIAQKPCPMSKKLNSESNVIFDSITCNLTNDRMSVNSLVSIYSIEDLPSHFKPFVILKKLKGKVNKKRIRKKVLKKSLNACSDTLCGLKNKLVKGKDAKSDAKENINIKNDSKAVPINCPKDEKPVEGEKENIIKENKLNIEKFSKPKVKVINLSNLKPNIFTIKHFTSKIDNELNQNLKEDNSSFAPSGKETPKPLESNLPLRRPRGRPKKSYGCVVDSSIIKSTPVGRIKFGRKKIRGRPIKRRRCGFHSSDSSDDFSSSSNSSFSDFEKDLSEDDYKENEEKIPTVELDLFTVSPFEETMSVLLIDPQNPNFKIFASTDAIFVGDSALGDITNHMGYISDSNNVVYVDPSHFLFPKVGMNGIEDPVLQSSEPIKYSFSLGKMKHNDKLNKIKKKLNDPSKVSSESVATVPIHLGDDDKENKVTSTGCIPKEDNLDATKQKEESSFKTVKVGVSKEINLPFVQAVNNSKMVVIEKFGFDNPPVSNLVYKEETHYSSNKELNDEISDSKERVHNEEHSVATNNKEDSDCKERANFKEVNEKNVSIVDANQDNDSKDTFDSKNEINKENVSVAHNKEAFDCKEQSDSDKQVNNEEISSVNSDKQDHGDKNRNAFIYKTPQKSSIVIKKKESRVLIQSSKESKVIVLKTSIKAEIEREKEAKESSEKLNSNISNLENDYLTSNHLEDSSRTSSVLPPGKRVLKTISVNPIDINKNSILGNGNYKLLANSQNPVIPKDIDCSGLDSIDVIDLTSLNCPPAPLPIIKKEPDLVEVQECSASKERISSSDTNATLTPKKRSNEILPPESPSSSRTAISSESNSIVTSTEINPFATLEDGVYLEEIIAESDPPIVPKEEDSANSNPTTPCHDQKNFISPVKEENFDDENSIDEVNVESDSEESSLINASHLVDSPLADIIKGNNVWNTPLLFSPDKNYSITNDDLKDFPLSYLSSPKSKWSKCGEEKHQTMMTDYLQKVKNNSFSSANGKNLSPQFADLKTEKTKTSLLLEKNKTSPLLPQKSSPYKKSSPKSSKSNLNKMVATNSQINSPTKSQRLLAKMTPTKLVNHSPNKVTTKQNKGQMLSIDTKKSEPTSITNNVVRKQTDSHSNSKTSGILKHQSSDVNVRRTRLTPVKVEQLSKSPRNTPTKTTSKGKISSKTTSEQAQPLLSPIKIISPCLKSPKQEPCSEDYLPKSKNTLVLSPVDLINKTFNSKKDNEKSELKRLLNHSQAEIELPKKSPTPNTKAFSDKVYEIKVEDDASRHATVHSSIEERNQPSKTNGLKMRIILKDFPKLDSSLPITQEKPSRTRKRKKKRIRKKRKLRKGFYEFGTSLKKVNSDSNVIHSLSSTTSAKEISPFNPSVNGAGSPISKYLEIKTKKEPEDCEQRKDQSESDLENETERVNTKRKIVLKQFGSLDLPPRETVNNVTKTNLDETGKSECAAEESHIFNSQSQKDSDGSISFPRGVESELKSEEKFTQLETKKKYHSTPQKLNIKSSNELVDERLWHSRKAKLKAQVMITDHQKGILNSSVVTRKSSNLNTEELDESVTTALKGKKESSPSQDIRSYFSKMASPSDNSPISPSSPLYSKLSSVPSEKEKLQKSQHFNESITPIKLSVSAPNKSPASQNNSSLSSKFKRKRKEKVDNMDIRQFLSAVDTEEVNVDSPAAKKQKVYVCEDTLPMEEVLEFEGFEQCLSCSDERSKLLQEYVDVLELNTLFNSSKFPLPVDQLCDWNEDELIFILFEKG